MNKPQLSAEMEKLGIINEDGSITFAYNELVTALEEQRKKHQEEIELKDKTIENMMDEIRYLRGSQPERRKPRIIIKMGEDRHIPMITQAHDTPDGLYIEAELAILNGKE